MSQFLSRWDWESGVKIDRSILMIYFPQFRLPSSITQSTERVISAKAKMRLFGCDWVKFILENVKYIPKIAHTNCTSVEDKKGMPNITWWQVSMQLKIISSYCNLFLNHSKTILMVFTWWKSISKWHGSTSL
jgi:hypothetical protein